MRTSERAYHQIRWDPRLAPERFVIGIDVHKLTPARVALPDFVPGGDVPWHRVLFIELDGDKVWDRATRVDRIDQLAVAGTARARPLAGKGWRDRQPLAFDADSRAWVPMRPGTGTLPDSVSDSVPDPLRVLTWNVLWNRYEPDALSRISGLTASERAGRAIREIVSLDAHLVSLQEVEPAFARQLLDHPEIQQRYWVSHPADHPDIQAYDLLILGRLPVHQVAVRPLGPHKALLAAAVGGLVLVDLHLTSDHSERAAQTRRGQLAAVRESILGFDGPVVVAGDFNVRGPLSGLPLDDAWLAVHPAGHPTYDPTTDALARHNAASSRSDGSPARLDRVLVRGLHAHDASLGQVSGVSDHRSILTTLSPRPPASRCMADPTVRSALAWIPEDTPDVALLQQTRRDHDPAFERWPPHVNVLWGFVDESRFDQATPALSAALDDLLPFETHLDHIHTFRHSRTATHGLAPTDPHGWTTLHARLRRAFPRCGRERLVPHLTFARTDRDAPAPDSQPTLRPLAAVVDELAVLTRRGDEPFRVRGRIRLDTRTVEWGPEPAWIPGPPVDPGPFLFDGAQLVGSHRLGAAIDDSDVDLVCPTLDASTVRQRLLAVLHPSDRDLVVPVVKNGLPGFRAWSGSTVVDVSIGDHPQVVSALADADALLAFVGDRVDPFRELLRVVKGFARAHALDDAAWGGVEGLAWAVLAARSTCESPDLRGPDLVHAFFARWASHDWNTPVSLEADDVRESGAEAPDAPVCIRTPTAPVRTITTRARRGPFEDALLHAWALLEDGGHPHDLFRPLPFHRRHPFALVVDCTDRTAAGHARGRGRALLDGTGAMPMPGRPHVLGLSGPDDADTPDAPGFADALAVAVDWARPLPGVTVRLVPSREIPSPSRSRL